MGPSFGNSNCYELFVGNEDYGSYLQLGCGYAYPENVNVVNQRTYFTGVSPSKVSELEVFKVNL